MYIETSRLILRDLRYGDFTELLAINNDPQVFFADDGTPISEAKLREWLDDAVRQNTEQPRTVHLCAIVLKTTNAIIGWIGFGPPNIPGECDLDFGYALNRAYRNQGHGTEAVHGMLAYCFDVLGAQTIRANHSEHNPASGRVMQKAGMQLDEEMTRSQANCEVYYVVTADNWRMRHER